MLAVLVQAGLNAVDGISFTSLAACPSCGGPVSGYDTRRKVFAVIREDDRERILQVTVKRFSCLQCGRIVNADEPFYPGTRIGSPVVDLCLTLSAHMPPNRTAAWLDGMDIILDRTSCRNYIRNLSHPVPASNLFGIGLPLSVISLSSLASRGYQGGAISGAEVLAACSFPSALRTPLHPPPPDEGKKGNAEHQEKEGETSQPEDNRQAH